MTIAVVLSELPFPTDSGDPLRALQFCQAVRASGVPVDFYVVERPTTTDADRAAFTRAVDGARVLTFHSRWASRPGRGWASLRWLTAAVLGRPAWIEQRFSPGMSRALNRAAPTYSQLYAVNEAAGPYVTTAPGEWHWDKSNVLSASRRQALAMATGVVQRFKAGVDLNISRRFERRVARRISSVSVTSADEALRWQQAVGAVATATLPSTVPVREQIVIRAVPRRVAWLGTFRYKPNWEGLLRFLEAAGPSFVETNSRLVLIGSGGNAEIERRLRSYEFVEYVGFAENLEDALHGCSLGVVPVWTGAGIKMKTLTLMSFGIPLVSTSVGAEGVPHDAFLAVIDDPARLAAAAAASYDEHELIAAGTRARDTCVARFSSPVFERAVVQLVNGATEYD